MIGFGEFVDDGVFLADTVKDVGLQHCVEWLISVLRQVGKRHSIVGQHGLNLVREGLDHTA